MSNNLYVLNTRPEPACWQLQQALNTAGINNLCQPLLEYQFNGDGVQLESLIDTFLPNIVIFISQAAVEFAHNSYALSQWLKQDTTIIAVGEKTQQCLANLGYQAIFPTQHNSEGMLALAELATEKVVNQHVLIIRGNGGREHLARSLIKRGAKVEYFESYQRNWLNIAAEQDKVWKNKQINAMVITSESQLIRMVDVLKPMDDYWTQHCTYIVPSERVADTGRALGLRNILISNGASDNAIVTTLKGME
ncbi:uroporphyrinogen-III synthase [Thalassotalea sp. 1_MG-2023]|uniref:uroporphyrinogen-III synthase n=1 Tax=Thalassotalea sp. 1_MG-2023 TaxID=3062680 RepID=UPI0026E20EEF|nr:uroporphyrinogen-III synthase [Thalassotalea sp. 1_MG-2023]MDO6425952.1 uroporphyrinogen-III synthase [Thalassotalea sp. 1_MG-2023]